MKMLNTLTGAIGLAAALSTCASAETVLRVGTFLAPQGVWHEPLGYLMETVNQAKAGLRLELVADPSSVSPFQLGDAVSSGVVDMAYLPGAFYTNLVPEADASKLFNVPVAELRENGAMDLFDEIHREKMGALFLSRLGDGIKYHIYTNRELDGPNLDGWDMRGTPLYRPFMEALGANVIQMQGSEAYAAMESGLVNGYAWPLWGIQDLGLLEVTKYRVEPGFYNAEVSVLLNESKWESLTDVQRNALTDAAKQTEAWFEEYREQVDEEQRAIQSEAGIEQVIFSDELSAEYVQAADTAGWAEIIKNSPEYGLRLKDLAYKDSTPAAE